MHGAVAFAVALAGAAGCRPPSEKPSTSETASLPPDLVAAPQEGYVSLALTDSAACAIHGSGRVACWGDRIHGKGTEWRSSRVPAWVDGLDHIARLATAGSAVCATKDSGEAWCWNLGPWGKSERGYAFTPTRAPHLDGLRIAMAPGLDGHHGCGVAANGDVLCWGEGEIGQTGTGPTSGYQAPRVVFQGARDVALGRKHTCAVLASGDVVCWGYGELGALGDGDAHERLCEWKTPPAAPGMLPGPRQRACAGPEPTFLPRPASALGSARLLAPSARCAVTAVQAKAKAKVPDAGAGERVQCWGEGWAAAPVDVLTGPDVGDIVDLGGADAVACARSKAGEVTCFGEAVSGSLRLRTPTRIPELRGAVQIAARDVRVCAIVARGRVRCVGKNASGLELEDWTTKP